MNERDRRTFAAMLGGSGAALLFGGVFAAGAMIVIPFQTGLVDLWREGGWSDPAVFLFVGLATAFLLLAGVGCYLCLRAYRLYRPKRPSEPES